MKFQSRHADLKVTKPSTGLEIQFRNGSYETDDRSEIAVLRAHPLVQRDERSPEATKSTAEIEREEADAIREAAAARSWSDPAERDEEPEVEPEFSRGGRVPRPSEDSPASLPAGTRVDPQIDPEADDETS